MYKREIKSAVGYEISDYCYKNRVTIGELAAKIGVPYYVINSVIYGMRKKITPSIAKKFLDAGFDVSKDYVVKENDEGRFFRVDKKSISRETLEKIIKLVEEDKMSQLIAKNNEKKELNYGSVATE